MKSKSKSSNFGGVLLCVVITFFMIGFVIFMNSHGEIQYDMRSE